eukprot:scaffold808_cov196-Alexandrium_tamarense.AAC.26
MMKVGAASISLSLLSVPFIAGHLHHHHHQHDDEHSHHGHSHNHYRRRQLSSLANDFSATPRADVFDSCLIACFDDIVSRFGLEFANHLKEDGFVFEKCASDNTTTLNEGTTNEYLNETMASSRKLQQHALNRILGATNLLEKTWSVENNRNDDGYLHIPYKIKTTTYFDQETLETIAAALSHIEEETGVIKFVQQVAESEYIYFSYETYYSGICASNLGRQAGAKTSIYLGWCRNKEHKGNIIHEVLHALGFWHEHSRPDRDDYITIQWDNIVAGAEDNFEKAAAVAVNSLGSPYDFNSIMHYTSNGFSIDSNLDTIVEKEPLESWEKMGQRMRLSVNDINQLRLLYQCKSGPRGGNVGVYDLCSTDCKCWENALGECSSDDECMGDLVCRDTPSPLPVHEYLDVLPQFPFASGTITCSSYCHSLCCQFPDNVVACPETCGTAPPPEEVTVVPSKMCIADDGSSGTTTSGTSGTGATSAGTTTIATTTATTSNNAKWYIDWSISKCVQSCSGPAPCGGIGQYVAFHNTVQQCCSAHLYWMDFSLCNTIPKVPATPQPSKMPTPQPTPLPSKQPVSSGPTIPQPSSSPTTAAPSKRPSPKPSNKPTVNQAKWWVDWNSGKCVQDCIGDKPCGGKVKGSWVATYTTVQSCCNTMSWKGPSTSPVPDPTFHPSVSPTTGSPSRSPSKNPSLAPTTLKPSNKPSNKPTPGTASNNKWYPGTSKCLNDGKEPSWQANLYTSQSTCCNSHFSWDYNDCMGVKLTGSYKWWIDWGAVGGGKCVQDCEKSEGGSCGGLVPGSYIIKHNNAEACCTAHLSYLPFSQCKYK